MNVLNTTLCTNSGLNLEESRERLMKTGMEMLSHITERWKEEATPFATIPAGSRGPIGAHLVVLPAPVGSSIRIARGATKQMLFIDSGDRLDAGRHGNEKVCSVEVTHQSDGKVSIVARDAPFICAVEYESSVDHWSSFRKYQRYTSLTPNKKQKLLASERRDGVWTIKFVSRHYKLVITPGETLVVTHTAG